MKNREEKVLLEATVSLLVKDNQVLLGIKKQKIGAGCLNGPGGGIEKGEDIIPSAIRELEEETGKFLGGDFITTSSENLEKVAIIDFHNITSSGQAFVCRVHFFIVKKWTGKAVDTHEMKNLRPYSIGKLPLHKMMPGDRKFFPLILKGKKIIGTAKYGPYQKELLEPMKIQIVQSFEES